jgi:hypothetical protein
MPRRFTVFTGRWTDLPPDANSRARTTTSRSTRRSPTPRTSPRAADSPTRTTSGAGPPFTTRCFTGSADQVPFGDVRIEEPPVQGH